ncbi:helix-turn-helix domain-containing protein [Coralliovum pocilloporae]|uniref:helix-turn-helix domain-containing protein n=1 Tax=Coralliovum pocilloporae TaxID=3066369 RepID=UPI003307A463
MTDAFAPPPALGAILRQKRKDLSLTLDQVATRARLSKSMLSQIERGLVNPTFSVVWNLTQALGLDMNELAGGASAPQTMVDFQAAYSTPTKTSADGRVLLRMLSPPRGTVLPVEWYDLQADAGGVLASNAHARGTYEHLSCLSGLLEVEVQETRVVLREGDTVRYDADQPHVIRNAGDGPARAVLMIALPSQYGAL